MINSHTEQILSRAPLPLIESFPITVLLVDDQQIIAEAVRRMLEDQTDIKLHYCNDPSKAIQIANEVHPTVILQDLVMPDVDGLLLVKYFRANPLTHEVPLIVLSAEEQPKIKAEAFALGANDYIVKLPDKVELVARIRYHSAGYIRLLERDQAFKRLEESQKILNAELAEAADYVRSLLPAALIGAIKTSWRFLPSTQLGGDAFGYHWIDQDHLAFYLLDVCGHGVGAALLSITLMNVLRSQTLQNTDFKNPSQVLSALNESFLMENHNEMFFTMWYGVYDKVEKHILYSCGGHPPAVLISTDNKGKISAQDLKTPGLAVGAMSGSKFQNAVCKVSAGDTLYLFSDGVYELTKPDGTVLKLSEFIEELKKPSDPMVEDVDRILNFSQALNGSGPFADDFSLIQLVFA